VARPYFQVDGTKGARRIVFTGGASVIAPTVSSANAALIGDSLTDDSFGITTFYWMNGIAGGNLKLIANSGLSGDTVANMLARVDNNWNAATRGLAGLADLEWIVIRAGTNDARASAAIAGTLTTQYNSLMAKLAGYATNVVVLAVPPLANGAQNLLVQDYNAFLAANFNSGQFHFIDDCVNVRDGSNNQIAGFFNVDGIHFNEKGVYQIGVDGGAGMTPLTSGYSSPLSTDSADVYPAQPQWFRNPTNAGAGGTVGSGFTGTVANNISIGAIGTGVAGTLSKVSADVGDANQTPWQRVTITQGHTGSSVSISTSASGRSISDVDPGSIDLLGQIRITGGDATNVTQITLDMQGSTTGEHLQSARLKLLGATGINKTVTVRRAVPRGMTGDTPASQGGANMTIEIPFAADFGPAANIGSIDFRCFTLRG
jgi:lysophospholipase L1-like esterase